MTPVQTTPETPVTPPAERKPATRQGGDDTVARIVAASGLPATQDTLDLEVTGGGE